MVYIYFHFHDKKISKLSCNRPWFLTGTMKLKGLLSVLRQAFPLKVGSNSVFRWALWSTKEWGNTSPLCYLEKNGYTGKQCFFKVVIKVSVTADYFPSWEKYGFPDKLPKSTQCGEMASLRWVSFSRGQRMLIKHPLCAPSGAGVCAGCTQCVLCVFFCKNLWSKGSLEYTSQLRLFKAWISKKTKNKIWYFYYINTTNILSIFLQKNRRHRVFLIVIVKYNILVMLRFFNLLYTLFIFFVIV